MRNPWLALPKSAPYILPDDRPLVEAFNSRAVPEKRYDLSLFPEPYFGRFDAPVVFLALNPGWNPLDAAMHSRPDFATQCELSLAHSLAPYPFLHLQPVCDTPGSLWWRRITKPLISDAGFDAVAKNISCLQFFPYHSRKFGSHTTSIPSQLYGIELVRGAMARGAEIVVMRSWKLWSKAVPDLVSYSHLHLVRNPRNPTVSANNLPSGYEVVLDRIKAGS
ncbi:hypothetical protein FHR47_001066 [Xanthomonas arboricola]|uniref:hypothetical protein n=1 Tax=Xanthomonas TaxID=338 RepID=UPI001612FB7A|nr:MULTISPECIES: hypothetical protein [Xanthomonas]MBB3800832.1 hypothetical protein [Xanthomonas cannabis]MCS3809766.1 hypothetical protein [Xanthomonas sp. 4461]